MKKITLKTGMALLLFMFLTIGLNTSCKKATCSYAPCTVSDSINISTGRDSVGLVDPNWIAISTPPLSSTIVLVTPAHSSWQTTPIAGTNAGWINCSGIPYHATLNKLGNYTYETSFTITNNTLSFSCDFALAYDDALVSLELVDPSSSIIPLTEPTHLPTPLADLGSNIGTIITNPAVGTWKLRATITTADHGTGLLVSGFIKTIKPC